MNIRPTHTLPLPTDRREALIELQKHLGFAQNGTDRVFRFQKATFVIEQIYVSHDRRTVAQFMGGAPVGWTRLDAILSDLRRRVEQDDIDAVQRAIQNARRAQFEKRRGQDAQVDDHDISIVFDKPKATKDPYGLTADERKSVIESYREAHGAYSEHEVELQAELRKARNAKQQRIEAENHARKLEQKAALKQKKVAPPAKVDKKAKKEEAKKQKKAA